MNDVTDSTVAAYFKCGIEVGMLQEKDAKEWAFSVIKARDVPPIEIIDVAMSIDREEIIRTLGIISRSGDSLQAGRWLLGLLKLRLVDKSIAIRRVADDAARIAKVTNQGDIYHIFDCLSEDIFLAENNRRNRLENIERFRRDLQDALSPYDITDITFGS